MGKQEELGESRTGPEEKPLVSVVVPTFGRADTIVRAINSIATQDYPNIEIVVVDDNDDPSVQHATRSAISSMAHTRSIILMDTGGRIGGGRARNMGVAASHGTFVAFLDDDDEYLPGKISSQVQHMLEEGLDLSYQDVIWVSNSGAVVEYRRLNHAEGSSREQLLRAHLVKPISPTAIYMLRRSLFLDTAGFGDVPVGQDWILMLRCIEAGARIGYMPGAFVKQYLHRGGRLSTGNRKIEGENQLYKLRTTYFEHLGRSDRRYVRFRHFAVLAVACGRSGFWIRAARALVTAVLISPVDAIREAADMARGRRLVKRELVSVQSALRAGRDAFGESESANA